MNRIRQIKLKNFKFFYGEVNIDFERQNALIFGENGSGKSSLYWSLYTFFQSVFKDTPQKVQKYFQHNHDENLRNRFADNNEDSYIKIIFEDEHQSATDKQISNTVVNTRTGTLVEQAVQGSDLINYKLLSKIHDFKNPQEIDLFLLMDKEILPFINFRVNLVRHDGVTGTTNAQEWWDYIKPGLSPRGRMHDLAYQRFAAAVRIFNEELQFYIASITQSVNDYLQKFKQTYTVSFEIKDCSYDAFLPNSTTTRNHRTIAPQILIHAHFNHAFILGNKQRVTRPHTFLNEAKLTAIALSIRFAMLDQKINGIVAADTPKILILDDVLISLDMSNREIVLDIILQEFTDYQLVILTHDRNFFELLRHRIKRFGQSDWKYFEMYECDKDNIPQPLILTSDTYLEKAEKYFYKKEYDIAGNFLRKEAESFCKDFLPKRYQFTSEYNLHDLNGLIKQCLIFADGAGLDLKHFEDLDSHRKFVLNPTSHDSYDVPKFNSEVGSCLETLKKLRQIANEPFLKRGELLEFTLQTADGKDSFKFEIKLEDDFRLLKQLGKESVISKGMINYWITKNTESKGGTQHSVESIKNFYDKNYNKSDKTRSNDFWEEIVISAEAIKLSAAREY